MTLFSFTNQQDENDIKNAKHGKLMSGKIWKTSIQSQNGFKRDDMGDAKGILEGISSLHSWIKKTNVLPTAKLMDIRSEYDEVNVNPSFLTTSLYVNKIL